MCLLGCRYGTPEQQATWLLPLLRGHIRSCFAMTEKMVASSDATNITAAITRVNGSSSSGGGYRVQGLKWWTSGAMDPRCKVTRGPACWRCGQGVIGWHVQHTSVMQAYRRQTACRDQFSAH